MTFVGNTLGHGIVDLVTVTVEHVLVEAVGDMLGTAKLETGFA